MAYLHDKLSSQDIEHFDRSEHFYKKHGFEVTFHDEKSGEIRYQLREEL